MTLRHWNHFFLFAGLVAVGVVGRVWPHPPNFTPVAAAALFAGFLFSSRLIAAAVPFTVLLTTDLAVNGTYDLRIMLTVYAALMFPVLFRRWIRGRHRLGRTAGACLCASVTFFLTTNLAVWLFSGIYSATWAGLVQCYVAAIPFFKYTLAGDLFWSAVLFGGYELAIRFGRLRAQDLAPVAPERVDAQVIVQSLRQSASRD